ncbi:Cytochrome P450 2D15 [Holothuria leucospilota]|uniref:Cytochrome P450 2D15 n=1 Tax=Holothuria leucospilota TaxID=206669 RepID=A0A9Q0YH53_HOLLE|nr:Cytochrome P450 2D15 [Holothuria leucospilota]
MLDTATVIVSLAAGTIAIVVLRYIQARKPVANYPPGPWGLPILGNLLQILKRPDYYQYFTELGEKYGNVYSCMLGHHNLVIVSGIDSIKEALITRGNDFADRPEHFATTLINPQRLGIADAYFTDAWYNQRHFAHKTLRGFGFGKTSFESKIMEEVEFLIQHFKVRWLHKYSIHHLKRDLNCRSKSL